MSSAFRTDCRRRPIILDRLLIATLLLATLMTVFAARGAEAREVVKFDGFEAGTVVIKAGQRHLFYVLPGGSAVKYPVAVGRPGFAWTGKAHIDGKYVRPAWAPPKVVKRDIPSLPNYIPGGSPKNPMGARALTLDRAEIAIHGTNAQMRPTVGTAVSYGCIRMYDEDVIDLYRRVHVGTTVVMTQ